MAWGGRVAYPPTRPRCTRALLDPLLSHSRSDDYDARACGRAVRHHAPSRHPHPRLCRAVGVRAGDPRIRRSPLKSGTSAAAVMFGPCCDLTPVRCHVARHGSNLCKTDKVVASRAGMSDRIDSARRGRTRSPCRRDIQEVLRLRTSNADPDFARRALADAPSGSAKARWAPSWAAPPAWHEPTKRSRAW